MSREYDLYLQRHKANVKRGYDWLRTNMPWLFEGQPDSAWQTEFEHDASKSNPDEYEAYDAYFYGGNRSYAVVQAFQYAWLLHIHRNPHHWQHWVLINDDPDEGGSPVGNALQLYYRNDLRLVGLQLGERQPERDLFLV